MGPAPTYNLSTRPLHLQMSVYRRTAIASNRHRRRGLHEESDDRLKHAGS